MSLEQLRLDLQSAQEHVLKGRRIVEAQQDLIARLRSGGHDLKSHHELLARFEDTLAMLEQRRQALEHELQGRKQQMKAAGTE